MVRSIEVKVGLFNFVWVVYTDVRPRQQQLSIELNLIAVRRPTECTVGHGSGAKANFKLNK
jgi:hypothetical protein